ncbi:LamG domain-containing protein [Paludisphaera soli]|uniref:LamG domain-containing protein n=1 Tax=Paludisphaera soli TaxID=2712865 RepID=UPI0013EB8F4F|nr:LamG domain-containing protein [Paludisphaera soli]
MTIEIHGNNLIASPSTSFLAGSSAFSLSVFVQVTARGAFSQNTLVGLNNSTSLGWVNNGGTIVSRIALNGLLVTDSFVFTTGTVYHYALVYDGATAIVYRNGNPVKSVPHVGVHASGSVPIWIGYGGGDQVYRLDDAAIWRGRALTMAEVRAIRDRTVAPNEIAPASLAYYLTLDGPEGTAAAAGTPGLTSLGTVAGLDPSSRTGIDGDPTYRADPLVYVPPFRFRRLVVGGSKKSVLAVFEDLNGVSTKVTALPTPPTFRANGGSPILPIASLWDTRLPYALFTLAEPLPEDAAVTLDAPSGWVSTTAGVADLMEAIPVEMSVGRSILPPVPMTPKTMTCGYNVQQAHNYSPVIIYRNCFYHTSAAAWTTGFGPNVYTVAENGELISNGQTVSIMVYRNNTNNGVDGRGYPTPPGVWTLMWDGHHPNVRITLTAGSGGTITQLTSTFTGAADNVKTFQVALNTAVTYYAGISVTIDGAQSGGVGNIRVYPPGEEEGASRFNSVFLSRLRGTKSIRFMDMIATNSCNIVNFEDWTPLEQIRPTRNPDQSAIVANVVQIDPYVNPIPVVGAPTASWKPLLFTCSSPHGFVNGKIIELGTFSAPVQFSGGGSATFNRSQGCLYVVNATQFALGVYSTQVGDPLPAQAISVTATAYLRRASPPQHLAELCNEVGANMHLNIPHAMTDAGVAQLVDVIGAMLNPGLKLRVEYSNEHWNTAIGFFQAQYFTQQGLLDGGLTRTQWFAKRSAEVHDIAFERLSLIGRGGDLIRQFGSWANDTSTTAAMVEYLYANGKPVDEVSIAPYIHIGPRGNTAGWNAADVDHVCDAAEAGILYDDYYNQVVTSHRLALQARYPDATVTCYEGGPDHAPSGGADSVKWTLNRKWSRHPRIRDFVLWFYQDLQNQGCTDIAHYCLALPVVDKAWGVYPSHVMEPGYGDGSDGKFDNRTNFDDQLQIVSPIGSAIDAWASLYQSGATVVRRRRFVPIG